MGSTCLSAVASRSGFIRFDALSVTSRVAAFAFFRGFGMSIGKIKWFNVQKGFDNRWAI
jgi:hypothetical protein